MIDSATRLCCLIGHPVEHSVSPQMHNSAFRSLGLNYVYLAFDVVEDALEIAVKGLKALRAVGFNVTIPHKIRVMRLLDELDESAERAGAVNTVVNERGALKGYNTDVYGIERALRRFRLPSSEQAMIIGAGGAARASIIALLNLGFEKILIANRTLKKAQSLADWIKSMGFSADACSLEEGRRRAESCKLIVNATPIGMHPNVNETPLSRDEIPSDSIILDLVYNPPRTKLLEEAEKAGARVVSGIEVLVYQGAESFKLWTGREAPIEVMREAALKALQEREAER